MRPIVIRPRIQIPVLVVLSAVWALLGVTYFTSGDVVAGRDWFGIVLGSLLLVSGMAGVWRALRLGVVVDAAGVRVRSFDSRDQVIPWNSLQSIDCLQVDVRAGIPLYAPVLHFHSDVDVVPLPTLGSYSRHAVERTVDELRSLANGTGSS
ncbi:hypothetical protein [Micromonospora maris]|uniref:hypothetical protein n=1 Tax=Micromonospora maris TaxID=1003110 RepID=UPI002E0D64F3|nr:hypothetical protein OG712_14715 [Micromonospora maris]